MIIGRAIGTLLDGMTIDICGSTASVLYNYGKQDALDKFIALADEKGSQKYPLVFYVINHVKELNEWKYCDTELIILQNTNSNWLSEERTDETYVDIIEPVYQKVKEIISLNSYIMILEEDRKDKFAYDDKPNFGMREGGVGTKKSENSVVTDYVDARIIKFNIKIKTNCIN